VIGHQRDDIWLIVDYEYSIACLGSRDFMCHADLATKLYHARENVGRAPLATAGICYNRVTLTGMSGET